MCRTGQESLAEAAVTLAPLPHEVVELGQDISTVDCIPVRKRLLRVLIVDDCRDWADILSMLVKMWGHDVRMRLHAPTGAAAGLQAR
jgi:hypothetical protein